MRRGIRFPQWWMLLVAILAILSGQGSLVGMERYSCGEGFAFAKRHRQTLNELLGTDFTKSPSDSTFRLLLAQLDVPAFETLLQDWMAAQPVVAKGRDTLVCDGKTLRGSIDSRAPAPPLLSGLPGPPFPGHPAGLRDSAAPTLAGGDRPGGAVPAAP